MNKTKIDWCDSTWNPVTGCLHGCKYCYARGQAHRFAGYAKLSDTNKEVPIQVYGANARIAALKYPLFKDTPNGEQTAPYPFDFDPTFHRYRLDDYKNKKGRTIFVGSMTDLFGDWVPGEWIEEVFKACENAPQHRYLFLTKNPKRYESLLDKHFPTNYWFGWSQEGPEGDKLKHSTHHSIQSFVSLEPLQRPFEEYSIRGVDWVIIGTETGNRKNKIIPKREWIENIVNQCRIANVPVFMKNSIAGIWNEPLIQQYPWEV